MSLFETDSQTSRTDLWLPGGSGGWGIGSLGVWDGCVHTTIFKIDNQQEPTV